MTDLEIVFFHPSEEQLGNEVIRLPVSPAIHCNTQQFRSLFYYISHAMN